MAELFLKTINQMEVILELYFLIFCLLMLKINFGGNFLKIESKIVKSILYLTVYVCVYVCVCKPNQKQNSFDLLAKEMYMENVSCYVFFVFFFFW